MYTKTELHGIINIVENKMTPIEIWNFLVNKHNEGKNSAESEIQINWEKYFGDAALFGYSYSQGDIEPHPNLTLGSMGREIPDILINKNNEKIFIAELKQYSIQKNDKFETQLLTYLIHPYIHLSIGILVCNKLYIYYYDFTKNSNISLEISFVHDDPDGIRFVELFSKANFNKQSIIDFITESNNKKNIEANIKNELNEELIKNLLKEHFSKKYPSIDFQKILKEYSFKISQTLHDNHEGNNTDIQKIENFKDKYALNNQPLAKRQIVLAVVKEYIKNNPSKTFLDLKNIFPDNLQGPLGVFQDDKEMLNKYTNNIKEYKTRFFTKDADKIKLQSENRTIIVCGEWGHNFDNFFPCATELGFDIKPI